MPRMHRVQVRNFLLSEFNLNKDIKHFRTDMDSQ